MRYQFRRGTAAEWEAATTATLAAGELALEYTSGQAVPKIKIGPNGTTDTSWNLIPYLTTGSGNDASTALEGSGSVLLRDSSGSTTKYSNILRVNNATDLSGSVAIRGAVVPTVPDTFSLGSTGSRWANIYMGATGSVFLGSTRLSDNSGNLQVSGSVVPGSATSSLGTATKPWKQMRTDVSMSIMPADTYAIDESTYGSTYTQITGLKNILDVAVSDDGSRILAIDASSAYLCTDGYGRSFTRIYSLSNLSLTGSNYNALSKCAISGNGSVYYFVRIYVENNTVKNTLIKYNVADDVASASLTLDGDFRIGHMMTSYDGRVVAFSLNNTNNYTGTLFVSHDGGATFYGISGLNGDNTPNIGTGIIFDMWLSSDGSRIYLSRVGITAQFAVSTTVKYLLQYSGTSWTSTPLTNKSGWNTTYPLRLISCDTPNITAYAGAFSGNGTGDAEPTHITIDTSYNTLSIGSSQDWKKLCFSRLGRYLTGYYGGTVFAAVISYSSSNIPTIYSSSSKLIPGGNITGLVLSGDGTRIIATTNNGNVYISVNPLVNTNGLIGIGTTNPTSRLDIAAPVAGGEASALTLRNSATTGKSVSMNFAVGDISSSKIIVDTSGNMSINNSIMCSSSATSYTNMAKYGTIWNDISAGVQSGDKLIGCSISPNGQTIAVATSTNLYRSINGGATFNIETANSLVDKSTIINVHSVDTHIFIATTGGLVRRNNSDNLRNTTQTNLYTNLNRHVMDLVGRYAVIRTNSTSQINIVDTSNDTNYIVNMPAESNVTVNPSTIVSMAVSSARLVVISTGTNVYISNNPNTSWTKTNFSPAPTGYSFVSVAMSATGSHIIIAESSSVRTRIRLSTNNGTNSPIVHEIANISITHAAVSPSGQYMAVSDVNGNIYMSDSFGVTWKQVQSTLMTSFNRISVDNSGTVVAISTNADAKIGKPPTETYIASRIGIGTTDPSGSLDVRTYDTGHPSVISLQSDVNIYGAGDDGPSLDFYTRNRADGTRNFQAAIQGIDVSAGDPSYGGIRVVVNSGGAQKEVLKLDGSQHLSLGTNPIGTINMYCSSTNIPNGWLLCNGAEIIKSSYPELFAIIGTSFGTPSDSTKFRIPNMSGRFPYGATVGTTGGSTTVSYSGTVANHTLTLSQIPAHTHGVNDPKHVHGPVGYWNVGSASGSTKQAAATNTVDWSRSTAESFYNGDRNLLMYSASTGITINSAGGGQGHSHNISFTLNNVIPPYIGLAYIIYTGRATQ